MAETWTPVTLTNDTGQKLNATYFNRVENGIDQIDNRAAALELGITAPVTLTASAGVITPNAAIGSLFRHVATADVVLADPIGGSDGQTIRVQVQASGASRAVSVGGDSVLIASGTWGRFTLEFISPSTWLLAN